MADPQFLKDKTAIVTGASAGIGRALAVALSRAGARVVLASRNAAALESLAAELKARGGAALVVPTDVRRDADVEVLIRRTVEAWGPVDILVANAGQYVRGPIASLTQADFERSLNVNFYGALRLILRVLPGMLERHSGHIVMMNSLDGRKGLPLDAPYVAAKFALTGYGDVLRQELHGSGVHVTTVHPGRVDTPMVAHLRFHWMSPKMPAELVASATLRAIRRGDPEVIIPFQGYALLLVNLFSPRFADWWVRVLHLEGWEQQARDA